MHSEMVNLETGIDEMCKFCHSGQAEAMAIRGDKLICDECNVLYKSVLDHPRWEEFCNAPKRFIISKEMAEDMSYLGITQDMIYRVGEEEGVVEDYHGDDEVISEILEDLREKDQQSEHRKVAEFQKACENIASGADDPYDPFADE